MLAAGGSFLYQEHSPLIASGRLLTRTLTQTIATGLNRRRSLQFATHCGASGDRFLERAVLFDEEPIPQGPTVRPVDVTSVDALALRRSIWAANCASHPKESFNATIGP